MLYSIWSSRARNSFSGGIEGRPVVEYNRSKRDDSCISAASVIRRIRRSG
jgi:hypothetical protein